MKIRLTEPGFEHFTGQMGVLHFEEGLSTTDCSHLDATRISAVMGATWEDGSPANVSQIYLDCRDAPAAVVPDGIVEKPIEVVDNTPPPPQPQRREEPTILAIEDTHAYSREELESVADKKGIAGLREIGDKIGVKGTSISALIQSILTAQGGSSADGEDDVVEEQ